MKLTPELLAAIVGIIISMLFKYIPRIAKWYNSKNSEFKQLSMLVMLAVTSGAIFGTSCIPKFPWALLDCSTAGLWRLIAVFVSALWSNQTAFVVLPLPKKIKKVKPSASCCCE